MNVFTNSMRALLSATLLLIALAVPIAARTPAPESRSTATLRVAILSFGATPIAGRAENSVMSAVRAEAGLSLVDRELSQAAARGTGYAGSLNLTTQEAMDLGSAIGCDFFIIGDAQTLRRSSSAKPLYFETYGTVFLVSARTGQLVGWDRRTQSAPTADAAEKFLLTELDQTTARYLHAIHDAAIAERTARAASIGHDLPVIAETPDDGTPQASGFRPPAPYRRVSPQYMPAAFAAEVTATVDAQVDLDIEGEVQDVQLARWAGFGLDESVTTAIRQMHFRPAMRNGIAFPIRVLLRYNFRKPK
jgi:TonB family protein